MSKPRMHRTRIKAPAANAGVTEAMIRYVVIAFYARVSIDPLLSPIFDRALGDDWGPHLDRMCDFWSWALLMTDRFKGTPIQTHENIRGLRQDHFERWQHLFRRTASEICPAPAAAQFIQKADTIGAAFFAAISGKAVPISALASVETVH